MSRSAALLVAGLSLFPATWAEAFDACRFTIDSLKKTVPIWEKEYYGDGELWIEEHP